MGASDTQSTLPTTLTGSRDGPPPAGHHELYVGIDIGRRHHRVCLIPRARMEDGSWMKAPAWEMATTGSGYRELSERISRHQLPTEQVAIGCEPTGGLYSRTVAAWLERESYRMSWLQNWSLHQRRQLITGKQTKTDALDARLIARLLFERDLMGATKGFRVRPPREADALRLLVRNRLRLVGQRVRCGSQLTALIDVLFPELKEFFPGGVASPAVRLLLENYPTPTHVAAADQQQLYALLVIQGRARRHAARIEELQMLAADSAGLTSNLQPLLTAQSWLLYQMRWLDRQIPEVEEHIEGALEAWPREDRLIMSSFPGMSKQRQAVLLASVGDFADFRSDRQLRKLLGWYPELRESGSSLAYHRLGRGGNRLARREIWLWCLQLLLPGAPTPFRLYYERLRQRGLSGKVAMGHVAGKLISVLFYCVRHQQPYDANLHARALGLDSVIEEVVVDPIP